MSYLNVVTNQPRVRVDVGPSTEYQIREVEVTASALTLNSMNRMLMIGVSISNGNAGDAQLIDLTTGNSGLKIGDTLWGDRLDKLSNYIVGYFHKLMPGGDFHLDLRQGKIWTNDAGLDFWMIFSSGEGERVGYGFGAEGVRDRFVGTAKIWSESSPLGYEAEAFSIMHHYTQCAKLEAEHLPAGSTSADATELFHFDAIQYWNDTFTLSINGEAVDHFIPRLGFALRDSYTADEVKKFEGGALEFEMTRSGFTNTIPLYQVKLKLN